MEEENQVVKYIDNFCLGCRKLEKSFFTLKEKRSGQHIKFVQLCLWSRGKEQSLAQDPTTMTLQVHCRRPKYQQDTNPAHHLPRVTQGPPYPWSDRSQNQGAGYRLFDEEELKIDN